MPTQSIVDVLPLDILELIVGWIKAIYRRKSSKFSRLRLVCKVFNELVEPQACSSLVIDFVSKKKWRTIPEFLPRLASGTHPFGRWAKELVLYRSMPPEPPINGWGPWNPSPWMKDPTERETRLACQKEWLIPAIESLVQVERVLLMLGCKEPGDRVLSTIARLPRLQHLRVAFPLVGEMRFDYAALGLFSHLKSIQLGDIMLTAHNIEDLKGILERSPSVTKLELHTDAIRHGIEGDPVDFSTLVEGIVHPPVEDIAANTKDQTFSPALKELSISSAQIRLSPLCVPFLRSLTSLEIEDDTIHVPPSFWITLANSGIRLRKLTVIMLRSPIVDYLLSYSGLRSIRLGRSEDDWYCEDQAELEHKFFHSILPMHRGTLQSLYFLEGYAEGIWGITQAYLDEGVYLCKELRLLHLTIDYFAFKDDSEVGFRVTPNITLAHLFSGISDNLPRLQTLKLDHTVKPVQPDNDDPASKSFYLDYGPHFLLREETFAHHITNDKSRFSAQRQPQFLLELDTATLMSSPVDSVSSPGSHCYQFQLIEGFESEGSKSDSDSDID